MDNDKDAEKIQYLLDNLFPYFWYKLKFQDGHADFPAPRGEHLPLSGRLIDLLRSAIWVHRLMSVYNWNVFLEKYFEVMISSAESYVTAVIYIAKTSVEGCRNKYDRFITAFSVVLSVAEFVCKKDLDKGKLYLDYSPKILRVFFERVIRDEFKAEGGWNGLKDFVRQKDYLKWYSDIVRAEDSREPKDKKYMETILPGMVEKKVQNEIGFIHHHRNHSIKDVLKHKQSKKLTSEVFSDSIASTLQEGPSLQQEMGNLTITASTSSSLEAEAVGASLECVMEVSDEPKVDLSVIPKVRNASTTESLPVKSSPKKRRRKKTKPKNAVESEKDCSRATESEKMRYPNIVIVEPNDNRKKLAVHELVNLLKKMKEDVNQVSSYFRVIV